MHSLNPVQEEPELEAQVEPAQGANSEPEPEQDKPWCITPNLLLLLLINIFMSRMIVH
jgi:hypothetical protein